MNMKRIIGLVAVLALVAVALVGVGAAASVSGSGTSTDPYVVTLDGTDTNANGAEVKYFSNGTLQTIKFHGVSGQGTVYYKVTGTHTTFDNGSWMHIDNTTIPMDITFECSAITKDYGTSGYDKSGDHSFDGRILVLSDGNTNDTITINGLKLTVTGKIKSSSNPSYKIVRIGKSGTTASDRNLTFKDCTFDFSGLEVLNSSSGDLNGIAIWGGSDSNAQYVFDNCTLKNGSNTSPGDNQTLSLAGVEGTVTLKGCTFEAGASTANYASKALHCSGDAGADVIITKGTVLKSEKGVNNYGISSQSSTNLKWEIQKATFNLSGSGSTSEFRLESMQQ